MTEPTKVYVTKYGITKGILVAEQQETLKGGQVLVRWPGASNGRVHLHPGEWSYSLAEAKQRVRKLLQAKRDSLAKTLSKLDKLAGALDALTADQIKPVG